MSTRESLHLRLITQNCFGVPLVTQATARMSALARNLNDSQLDVICLQEVQTWHYYQLLSKILTSYPYQACEPFLYAPKGGLLTLARHSISATRFVTYRQRGRWYTPGAADRLLHKGALVTYLSAGDWPLAVVNTHLLANYAADWSPRNDYARQQHDELTQLAEAVQSIDAGVPVVIVGDFNVPAGTWLFDDFLEQAGVEDLLPDTPEPTYRRLAQMPARYAQSIDHVLLRRPPGCRVESSAQLAFREPVALANGRTAYLSDHLGIEAHIVMHEEES